MQASKKRLLVLDDRHPIRDDIRELLVLSYDCETSALGADPARWLRGNPAEGVIISLVEDVHGALEAASRIKRALPSTVVILLGNLSADAMHEAFQARVDAIVDPGDGAGLEAALASRLGLPTAAV